MNAIFAKLSTPRFWGRSLLVLPLLMALGCGNEPGVQRYQVERANTTPAKEVLKPWRIVAAIAPTEDKDWFFFTVKGDPEQLAKESEKIDALFSSLKFPKDSDIPTWTLPAGWRMGKTNSVRLATFVMGPANAPIEMTLTRLGGSLLENVNRWRKEVGLNPVAEADIAKDTAETRSVEVDGKKITRVDVSGTAAPNAGMMPPFMKR